MLYFGFWSRWIAYVTVTIDILAIGLSLTGDLVEAGLPGRFAAALPAAVAALLVLAIGSLRLRPAVQIYSLALMLTLLGDTVNVANRLEQATKIHDMPRSSPRPIR
ncbi:MAG: hypothetical protein E6G87_12515 [Alphaproteobacteria bacterium]|nr:MAG: hypothetical protein E6G87_12515 [Alphaproteobacteria bacterium]